jgi:hypothetical protein
MNIYLWFSDVVIIKPSYYRITDEDELERIWTEAIVA